MGRMARALLLSVVVVALSLLLGVLGYRYLVHLGWLDALLNASMILGGMGPVETQMPAAGKVFASIYALFSGLMLVGLTGILLAPIAHRMLHKFHLDESDLSTERRSHEHTTSRHTGRQPQDGHIREQGHEEAAGGGPRGDID